MIKFNYLSLI